MYKLEYLRKKAENLQSKPYLLLLSAQLGRVTGTEENSPDRRVSGTCTLQEVDLPLLAIQRQHLQLFFLLRDCYIFYSLAP